MVILLYCKFLFKKTFVRHFPHYWKLPGVCFKIVGLTCCNYPKWCFACIIIDSCKIISWLIKKAIDGKFFYFINQLKIFFLLCAYFVARLILTKRTSIG